MRKILFLTIAVLAVCLSCKNNAASTNGKFVIEGTVADTSCEGAQIFLVPLMEEATHETVDSVVIKDGKFHFEGTKCRVAALRMQMPQRMRVQELLVYTEPGTIKAYVDVSGSVTGTKHNDLLQQWKQVMSGCVHARSAALNGHTIQEPKVKKVVDSLQHVVGDATYKLLKQTELNDFSRFMYMNNRYNLTDEQRSDLKEFEDDFQDYLKKAREAAEKRQTEKKEKK